IPLVVRGGQAQVQWRWRGKALQGLSPERFGLAEVLLSKPGHILLVRPYMFPLRYLAAKQCFVAGKDIAQNDWHAPAIQQQMVMTPDKLICLLSRARQEKAHQRSLRQDETRPTVLTQAGF